VPPKLSGLYDAIRAEVASHPDATLAELRRWLGAVHGVSASDGLLHGTLVKLGLTHKKRRCMPPSSTVRTSRLRVRTGSRSTLRRHSTCCAGGTFGRLRPA
jgi:transposase